MIANGFRWVKDLGMFTTDRDKKSCKWRTKACEKCYNNKLYVTFPKMHQRDEVNEFFWQHLDEKVFARYMGPKRTKQTEYFRFQTRGETFKTLKDVDKVYKIVKANPEIKFWIPTRAWRNDRIGFEIMSLLFPLKNAYIQASTDVYTLDKEWKRLKDSGWSTLFYGVNDLNYTPNGDKMFKCPKTFEGKKAVCPACPGCFSDQRTDTILRDHSKPGRFHIHRNKSS